MKNITVAFGRKLSNIYETKIAKPEGARAIDVITDYINNGGGARLALIFNNSPVLNCWIKLKSGAWSLFAELNLKVERRKVSE